MTTKSGLKPRFSVLWMFLAVLVVAGLASSPARAGNYHGHGYGHHQEALPIVFVHGFSGSGAQYETQALRWASNRYPQPVTAIDRTGGSFNDQMDAFVDTLLDQTGQSQIYVLAHSAGTFLMASYLNSSPERAARVAKYISIDGVSSATCPGDVPCMGLWARGPATRMMGPDNNVYLSEQGHTQVVGSAEGFEAQYEFLLGHAPKTTSVLPEPPGRVEIAGRLLNYPANTGMDGATVQIWRVNRWTGRRMHKKPGAVFHIDASGNWGPARVHGLKRYEIHVIRPEGGQQHFYYEPFVRSNYLIRLNLSPVDSALSNAIERGPHSSISIVRQKEWWGNNDVDPANVDSLLVKTTSAGQGNQAPVEIVNAATAPYAASTIAMIAFDVNVDQTTDVSQLVSLGPFLSGVDLYMPAADPPDGTVTFLHEQRREGRRQVINTPNWASEELHGMTINFRDWTYPRRGCKWVKPGHCR
jgi:pimeloyl-ACP methyl ester carboxylesterase